MPRLFQFEKINCRKVKVCRLLLRDVAREGVVLVRTLMGVAYAAYPIVKIIYIRTVGKSRCYVMM